MSALQTAPFRFEGLTIERIIVHRIYARGPDKQLKEPKVSSKLINLEQAALDALQMRITAALGNKSHGLEMTISEVGENSFFQVAATMIQAQDDKFIALTKALANGLNKAQLNTTAPGGMLAIINGRVGKDSLPFIAAIKAEPQDGFKTDEKDDQVTMEYIAELLLTNTQRLYKIGLLTEIASKPANADGHHASNYRAFLFDHLMTATETRSAAIYFYRGFLGMDTQASSKKLTQDFFELTRSFIDTSPITDDKKIDFHESLRSELRSQEATISVAAFGVKHFQNDMRKQYEVFMHGKGFPQNAVNKDTDYIHCKLSRRRKYIFTNGVSISTPPEKAEDFLEIEPANTAGITVVRIKASFKGQE
ncbi:MAG: nucleoid-associated protein [Gallionella sp.]|nr:nucleoid-associated protein [Gallionella sp.]MDP1941733.1 nucleoid-associated protein [Gallionella sp.]